MTGAAYRYLLMASALAGLVGCANFPILQPKEPKPAPVTPQITEQVLRDRAREQFAQGVRQYDAGDFDNALKNLNSALDHGLLSKTDQSGARKRLAFIHCASNREAQCRDEFRKAFEIDPDFSLSSAEDGHPIWGPAYRNVRTQLITEREAARAKPLIPLAKAEQLLSDGMVKYDSGDYVEAQRLLEAASKEGIKEKADQIRSLKHTAFCLCLQSKWPQCRATFVKIYDIDPEFDLLPAEAGHPSWTKTFIAAKAQAKKALAEKALAEKALAEKAAKEKAAQQKLAPSPPATAAAARDKPVAPATAAPVPPPAKNEPAKKN